MRTEKTKIEQRALPKGAQFISFKELEMAAPEKMASPADFAIWIRGLLQGWRQGTVAVKGRSDVARTNKKPWKQKGTGRARAGTARSPLWRGGGVTFGPQARVKQLDTTKQKRKDVFLSMLADRIAHNRVIATESKSMERPRAKEAQALIDRLGLTNNKVLLLLPFEDEAMALSFANLKNVNAVWFDQANAFDLANADYWLVLNKDLDSFKRMVSKWS